MRSLIEGVKERVRNPAKATDAAAGCEVTVPSCATAMQVDAAEALLGFSLPPLLRTLYLEVANGGFGPGYGLIGVPTEETGARRRTFIENYYRNIERPRDDPQWWPAELVPVGDFDIVETYRRHLKQDPNDPEWEWPARLLPTFTLGCGMYECVDCTSPHGPIIWFEPNPREAGDPLMDFLVPLAPSLERRLEAWLADEDLMEAAFEHSALKRRLE